jgi:hypothetical protein
MKPEWIWNIDSCLTFLETAEGLIASPINTENGEELAAAIGDLIAMYPSSSSVVASMKYHNESNYRKQYEGIARHLKEGKASTDTLPLTVPSVLKDYIKSRTADTQALLVRAERINAAITHAIEGLRSVLSKVKEDRKMSNYAQQV